jgi:pyruvate kinase
MAGMDSTDAMEAEAVRTAMEKGYLRKGDTAVITAGLPLHVQGATNLIKVAGPCA